MLQMCTRYRIPVRQALNRWRWDGWSPSSVGYICTQDRVRSSWPYNYMTQGPGTRYMAVDWTSTVMYNVFVLLQLEDEDCKDCKTRVNVQKIHGTKHLHVVHVSPMYIICRVAQESFETLKWICRFYGRAERMLWSRPRQGTQVVG